MSEACIEKCKKCGVELDVSNRDNFTFTNGEEDILCLACSPEFAVGDKVVFETSADTEDGGNAQYTIHSGQTAVVARVLLPPEIDPEPGPLYEVVFSDGVTFQAFQDELTAAPKQYVEMTIRIAVNEKELARIKNDDGEPRTIEDVAAALEVMDEDVYDQISIGCPDFLGDECLPNEEEMAEAGEDALPEDLVSFYDLSSGPFFLTGASVVTCKVVDDAQNGKEKKEV